VGVTIVAPGIGGPATALVVEKLAACGARGFIGVGFAGSVHPLLRSGVIVVAERAESDEGVSRHYVAPGEPLEAHPGAKEALEAGLGSDFGKYQCGAVWTTDAVYRETVGKAREFRKRGCAGVDMETAALYAVAKKRGLAAAAALLLADELCRFAPLDVETPDNLVWEWKPAAPGTLDGVAGAMLRGALGAVTGFDLGAKGP
jgi:uridine phosphorylase